MRRWLLTGGLIVLLCLAGLAAFVAYQVAERFDAPGPLAAETSLVIPRGAALAAIAEQLEAAGVISDALAFRLSARYLGAARDLQAGEYAFPPAVTMRSVLATLTGGETLVRRLTLPEGLTSVEAVALVAAAEGLSGAVGAVPPEGSLLPETYHYARDDDRAELIARMQADQAALLAELWAARDPKLPLASPEEAVVLASIIEKETGVGDERKLVASVFINRLRRGMRLQSDPTVVYGLTKGQSELGRALTRQDLRTPSPYNTYLIDGLPPGPIANAGRAALEAVFAPAETEYLYFVADGSGGHAFAKTLEEHNKNAAKWRRLQREKAQESE